MSQDTRSEPDWRQVKLLFVRGVKGPGEGDVGKKDWALFVTTDVGLSVSKMLEIYALRWGIEVYFKEAKQHLGFVTEQTRTVCLARRFYPFVCDSLFDVGSCQVDDSRTSH